MNPISINNNRDLRFHRISKPIILLFPCLFIFFTCIHAQNKQSDTLLVFFEFDKSILTQSELSKIDEATRKWQNPKYKIFKITILGYADSTGTTVYNYALSKRRARHVENILSERLDSSIKFSIAAFGERQSEQPDIALDRKVEIMPEFVSQDPTRPAASTSLILDRVIQLSNIQFVEDQPYITSHSLSAMPSYIALLKAARYDKMHIVGYYNLEGKLLKPTDPRFVLSEKRAKVIKDYLIEAGLDSSNITYEGGGNSQMVIEKPITVSEMRKNIRVEIFLFINK